MFLLDFDFLCSLSHNCVLWYFQFLSKLERRFIMCCVVCYFLELASVFIFLHEWDPSEELHFWPIILFLKRVCQWALYIYHSSMKLYSWLLYFTIMNNFNFLPLNLFDIFLLVEIFFTIFFAFKTCFWIDFVRLNCFPYKRYGKIKIEIFLVLMMEPFLLSFVLEHWFGRPNSQLV